MPKERINLVVIGAGYVGLTTGVTFAFLGHKVSIIEKDKAKLDLLKEFKPPFYEPYLSDLMKLAKDNLYFSDKLEEVINDSQIIMIAVGTPCKENGQVDNRFIEEVALDIGQALNPLAKHMIVIKSTVPVGTNRRVSYIINKELEKRKIKKADNIIFASNPEFLREGQAIMDMLYPDRVVFGVTKAEDSEWLKCLYEDILYQSFPPLDFLRSSAKIKSPQLIITDPTSAELIKYAANAFLAMKVSFINEMAGFCELLGANINDVANGIGADHRIGRDFLDAGIGWGGSCFPKDTAALVAMGKELGYQMRLVEATREVNYNQRKYVVDKIQKALKGVRGKVIGLLGLAFKPGTDDMRESPSLDVIRLLLEREAQVRVHDPLVTKDPPELLFNIGLEIFDDPYRMAVGADAILLATAWPEYKTLNYKEILCNMRGNVFFDGRNILDPHEMKNIGFDFKGVGY